MANADWRKHSSKRSSHVCKHGRRKDRQREAVARQEKRDRLSNQGQAAVLSLRPGNSIRERARLNV